MDKNVINSLIICKQDFDKKFELFAFKQDFEAVFKHEYEYYVVPICEKIVPLLHKSLKNNPELEINQYLPYIVPKYHDLVKKEVCEYEKSIANMAKNVGKKIKESFLNELMKNFKETEENKIAFINDFFKKSSHLFNMLIKSDPLYALTVCAQLRNSRMQNLIVSSFSEQLKRFIEGKNQAEFVKDVLPLFIYPMDSRVDDYYNKWVGKEAIHVKFSKDILGHHYEFAKQTLKQNERLKRQTKNSR